MTYEFKMTRQVEFADTDMAGIVHFSNYFLFMEAAEHAFYRSLDFTVHDWVGERFITWPRLEAHCRYLKPLRLEDVVEVQLLVKEVRNKTITYEFVLRKQEEGTPTIVARGSILVICIERKGFDGEMKSIPIPKEIAEKIEPAPEELFLQGED